MSRNTYDGLCGVCGEKIKVLDGEQPLCKDCMAFGIESIKIASGLPREVNWKEVPQFVIDKQLHRRYRTFLMCQFREPQNEEDITNHLEICFRCRVYANNKASKLESNGWWHTYPERFPNDVQSSKPD